MSFYPSSDISKRFEEANSKFSWQEVPPEIKPSLSESIQYGIAKRKAKFQEMYKTCTALAGAILLCRFAPESIPILPTFGNEVTVYALGSVALFGIADRVGIIAGENEYISKQYDTLMLDHAINVDSSNE